MQPQSQENVTPEESPANPSIQNVNSHRSSSASLAPPLHQLNRQRGVTSPPHILSRPLTSPPPLIPSPARDPEKSKHLGKEFAKSQPPRDDERGRLFSADRNRQKPPRDQESRDADKGQVSSQDQAVKDSEKQPPSRELQKDSDKYEVSGREPEKRTSLSKDFDHKESERGKLVSRDQVRDSEKGRQVNRGADKGRHGSRDPIHRESNKSKSFSRDPSNKETENSRSLSKDAGLREPDKHKQYNKDTGKDSGQVKDRLSGKDADKSRPPSRDFSNRSTERNKDSGSGKDRNTGTQFKQAGDEAKNPGLVPASSGQYSPPVGTAALTGQQRVGGTKHTDKQGKHGGKDQDDSMSPTLMPRHRLNSYSTQSTGNAMQASFHKDSVVGKTGSPQSSIQKSGARKSNDYLPGPVTAAALKPLWPSWTPAAEEDVVKQGSVHSASPAASLAKEKPPKVKTAGGREVSKDREREKTLQNNSKMSLLNNNTKPTGSFSTNALNASANNGGSSRVAVLGNSIKAHGNAQGEKQESQGGDRSSSKNRENYHSSERRNSAGVDNMQQSGSAPEREVKTDSESHPKPTPNPLPLSSREKRKSVKLPAVSALKAEMKLDPNGTSNVSGLSSSSSSTASPASQGTCRPALAALYSPSGSSSDGSESDTQTPTEEDLRTKHLHIKHRDHHSLLSHAAEDEGDGPEDDHDRAMDDKHLEDDSDGSGSAKRRYPRRSARARSNMFFGLTPFYGVRSYGEEDLPFYGSGDSAGAMVKRRTGIRKKSAEGQVDGADDMSSTSSSGDSGEDDDEEMKESGKDPFYSSFTRTIINPGDGLPSIEGIDQCVGRGSQLQRFLKDEAQQQQRAQGKTEEDILNAL